MQCELRKIFSAAQCLCRIGRHRRECSVLTLGYGRSVRLKEIICRYSAQRRSEYGKADAFCDDCPLPLDGFTLLRCFGGFPAAVCSGGRLDARRLGCLPVSRYFGSPQIAGLLGRVHTAVRLSGCLYIMRSFERLYIVKAFECLRIMKAFGCSASEFIFPMPGGNALGRLYGSAAFVRFFRCGISARAARLNAAAARRGCLQQKLVVVIILDERLVIYVAYRSERLIFAVPDGLHITSLNSFLHHQNLKYRNGLYVLPTRQALDAATVTITNSVPAAALSHAGGVPKRRYISLRSAGIIGNDSSSAAIIR